MPDPISSSRPVYDTCDPNNACCNDPLPEAAPASAPSRGSVVNIDPVVVTGDAGARDLIRQYDSQSCAIQTRNAAISCLAIGAAIRSAAVADPISATVSAFQTSLSCGKELRALYDCETEAAAQRASLAEVVSDCHEQGGVVKGGAEPNEVICEVP
jgi:hypothetical protein